MNNQIKQLSNSFSTGGLGTIFETRVQASFVILMLTGSFAPCLPLCPIKKIKLQGKYAGYDTDDLIVFVESPDAKKTSRLLCQIKHSITIGKNRVFKEVIQSAWNDFANPDVFSVGKDAIALITGLLSDTDIQHVRPMLDCARHAENADDFITQITLPKYNSPKQTEKLNIFRECINDASNSAIPNDVFWQFIKSFHLLGYDLDFLPGVHLSLLHSLIRFFAGENAGDLWPQILHVVQSANQSAGTITLDSLPEEIRAIFTKQEIHRIPAKDLGIKSQTPTPVNWNLSKLATAILLGGWDENR